MKCLSLHIALWLACIWAAPVQGQQVMGLDECIETALENNLGLRKVLNQSRMAEYALKQAKFDFLPSLNGILTVNKGLAGRSIDNFSLSIVEQPTNSNFGLSSNLMLFQGFNKWHVLRQRDYSADATLQAVLEARNDLSLQVSTLFFQVVFDRENLDISQGRYDLIVEQMERAAARVKAGVSPEGELLNLKAQLASERLNSITLENQWRLDRLSLFQLMNMQPDEDLRFELPELPAIAEVEPPPPMETIYETAQSEQPAIRRRKLEILAAESAFRSSKSLSSPSLSLNLGASSFYSSNALNIIGYDSSGFPILAPGTPTFFDQAENNLGVQAGLTLSVPIFQQLRLRQQQFNAQIGLENAELDLQIELNDLYALLSRARLDVVAAQARLLAADEQLRATETAFQYAQARFDAGLLDFFSFRENLNALSSAQLDHVQAGYDFWLKMKILDLYMGREVSL